MKTSQYSLESILGVIVRARKQQGPHDADQFSTLLVHKEILGDQVFVPLNIEKLWNQ